MFELKILVANVVVPTVLCSLAALISVWRIRGHTAGMQVTGTQEADSGKEMDSELGEPSDLAFEQDPKPLFAEVLAALAAAVAICLSFGLRNELTLWDASESWIRIPAACALVACTGWFGAILPYWLKWILRALATLIAAHLVFPSGEAWEFLQESKTTWIALMCAGTLLPWLLVSESDRRKSAGILLTWIGSCIAAAFLTAQSFIKVTEPLMAVACVFGVFGIASLCSRIRWAESSAGGALFGLTACTANAQFNSFLGLSDRLSFAAMLTPSVIVAVAVSVGGLKSNSKRGLFWVTLVVVTLITVVALIVWTYNAAEVGLEEEW